VATPKDLLGKQLTMQKMQENAEEVDSNFPCAKAEKLRFFV
jgi:hypothetical protein